MPRKRKTPNLVTAADPSIDQELRREILKKFKSGMAGVYLLYHTIHDNEVMLERMRNELGTCWWELQQQLLSEGLIELINGTPAPTSKGVRFVLMLSFDQSLN